MAKQPLSDQAFQRYSRQVMLSEWGEDNQSTLANAKVLIVGCGGLGTAAGLYLSGAGVGQLVLADDDELELSNLPRQVAYRESDLGSHKAKALAAQLSALNSESRCRVVARRLSGMSLSLEVSLADVVLDCSDNMQTRQAVNKACTENRKPLVAGAAIGWQGQLMVFDFSRTSSPCYHCLFPVNEEAAPRNCQSAGVVGPVVGTIGNFQALEALKLLMNQSQSQSSFYQLDGKTLSLRSMKVPSDPTCSVCQCVNTEVPDADLA
ncbi:HesA/MoeB/ThiF family protein [Enterovibrio sp. ZSDZ35]|uniref:HesA/MoeB/ThiF family protein n=1 Tax=Enterovibrio qingdaonensis TaxID=2899818 RepID=A0ABT5QSP2_9GAMM|nr:HesA/MoeB/ThiF family protein [Enterovibrio sp. ZSDZ35]MDD1783510.1 HesA/MoeB/ThiF family protein [Enterovibrio sp. ZSDZ35]